MYTMHIVWKTNFFNVVVPKKPHIDRTDGGHLVFSPKRTMRDRTQMSPEEAIELSRLLIIVGSAMTKALTARGINIGRINYQDNGNWHSEFHVHLYGRARDAVLQPFGQALWFPDPRSGFYEQNKPLDPADVLSIANHIAIAFQSPLFSDYAWHLAG